MRRWLVIACAGAVACGGYELVDPQANHAPSASVEVELTQGDSAQYEIFATFRRGADPVTKKANEVSDERFYLNDTSVSPESNDALTWKYRLTIIRAPGQPPLDTMRVRFPALADMAPVTVLLRVPRRQDSTIVTWGADALVLHVTAAENDFGLATHKSAFWALLIAEPRCGANGLATVHGSTSAPSELRVPNSWFTAPLPDSAEACFDTSSSSDLPGAPYSTFVSIGARINWRIVRAH
jgi:hypothetical protein